jgi:hypothetical protein
MPPHHPKPNLKTRLRGEDIRADLQDDSKHWRKE